MLSDEDINIAEYAKLAEIKNYLLSYLKIVGLNEQVRVANDDDLDKLVRMVIATSDQLKEKSYEDQVGFLTSYIICMWAKLIIDYGADIEDL